MRKLFVWVLIGGVVLGVALVRLAPTDAARWHVPVAFTSDQDMPSGAVRVIPGDAADLQRLQDVALQSPRTEVLAGDVDSGMITFVTRSRWVGFPDFTTVQEVDGMLRMHARLRFGKADLGVNRARLQGWIRQLARG